MSFKVLRIHLPDLLIILFTILFVICWFYLALIKFLSFHDFYGDLGQNTSYLIAIYNTKNIKTLFEEVRPQSYFSLFIAGIIGIFPSAFTLVTLQIISTGLTLIFLYIYAYKSSQNKWHSFFITLSYSLSFSLNANLWQSYGHIMEFFPLFFFAGFAFKDRKYIFNFLIIIASLTNIVMLLSMILLLLIQERKNVQESTKSKLSLIRKIGMDRIIAIFVLLVPISLFFLQENFTEFVSFNNGSFSHTNSSIISQIVNLYINNFMLTITSKILTLLLILIPFVLVFTKRNKKFIIFLPVCIFIIFSNYAVGYFNFQFYLSSTLVPLLFFLFIESYGKFSASRVEIFGYKSSTVKSKIHNYSVMKLKQALNSCSRNKVVFYLLISTVIISLFYAPWGPLNSSHIPGQNLNSYYHFNNDIKLTQAEQGADKFLSFIPRNATVLIQDNMPIFSNRDRNYIFGPNLIPTNKSVFQPGPTPKTLIPQFIVIDSSSYWFTAPFESGYNMAYWVGYYTTHYHYGVRAISGEFELYELNYKGNVTQFS
jgi:uncharacterized membrane protein